MCIFGEEVQVVSDSPSEIVQYSVILPWSVWKVVASFGLLHLIIIVPKLLYIICNCTEEISNRYM